MESAYVVRAIPVRNTAGQIAGWVRVDIFADGTKPTDKVIVADGSMYGQAEAMKRISADRSLIYPTEDAAIRDGVARLRQAEQAGQLTRIG